MTAAELTPAKRTQQPLQITALLHTQRQTSSAKKPGAFPASVPGNSRDQAEYQASTTVLRAASFGPRNNAGQPESKDACQSPSKKGLNATRPRPSAPHKPHRTTLNASATPCGQPEPRSRSAVNRLLGGCCGEAGRGAANTHLSHDEAPPVPLCYLSSQCPGSRGSTKPDFRLELLPVAKCAWRAELRGAG